jgi:DNA-binding transcriptional LysR family regulator
MQVHQLRYFVAAAEEMGISRAADRLRVSQPALSRQIRLLEDELGAELFLRHRQRIRLTPAGRYFRGRARRLLSDLETAARTVAEKFGGDRRALRLGFIGPFLDDLVAPAAREFHRQNGGTPVQLIELAPREQIDRLQAGELDLAILGNIAPRDQRRFRCEELMRIPMAAVLPRSHRLAGAAAVRLGDLSREAWQSLSDANFPGRRAFLESTCRRAGFRPAAVKDSETLPLMLAAIASGEGVGIAPLHAVKIPHQGCVFIPISFPEVSSPLLVVSRKNAAGTRLAALLSALRGQAEAIAASPGRGRSKASVAAGLA